AHASVLCAASGRGRLPPPLAELLPTCGLMGWGGRAPVIWRPRGALAPGVRLLSSPLTELDLPEQVDAVFSNAVFHWVPDHDALFRSMFAALKPGGRIVAQCGGAGNVERFHSVLHEVAAEEPFAEYLGGWQGPWNVAD